MENNTVLVYKENGEDLKIVSRTWEDVISIEMGYGLIGTEKNFMEKTRKFTDEEKFELVEFFRGNLQITKGDIEYKAQLTDNSIPIEELLENIYIAE